MGNDLKSGTFSANDKRFITGISFILGLRQFGMLLVMPFLSVYGMTLNGATSALAGLSLGIYALTQGCLQVPYGIISDKVGRKPVVIFGIMIQIAGFAMAFQAKSIQLLIVARALQGSGAINSVALSWVGDHFCSLKRSRAMRITSTVSSVAIALSLICGTIFQKLISVPQIFLICLALSLLALLYLVLVLKKDTKNSSAELRKESEENKSAIRHLLMNRALVKLYVTGFISNFMLTGIFFLLPYLAKNHSAGDSLRTIILSIPIIVLSMRIVNRFADKGKTSLLQTVIFAAFTLSVPCLFAQNTIINSASVIVFFAGIMCQYYLVTAGVNQLADKEYRATINGVANTIGYAGSFLGGLATGIFWDIGLASTMAMLAVICLFGLIVACSGCKRRKSD